MINKCYCMDNLELMKQIPNNYIDLIYCDILYGTGKDFKDYKDIKSDKETVYNFYYDRFKEMYRILKEDGAIYIHCDTNIQHHIRYLLDEIFGTNNFRNEIIWCYKTTLRVSNNQFGRDHDNIYFYTKTGKHKIHPDRTDFPSSESTIKRWEKYADENGFVSNKHFAGSKSTIINTDDETKGFNINYGIPRDWWEISANVAKGNTGEVKFGKYATQKPKQLLKRIIMASSNKGDVVADFFCGSGTTGVVAKELGRNYILCDINPKAIEISEQRLKDVNDKEM